MIDVTSAYAIPLVWPRRALDLTKVDGIAIHHTVTLYLSVHATEQDERNQISMIHTYHKSRGWGGFAYHIISFPSGRVYLVVPLTQMGTHVRWQNNHLLGIVVAGNFTSIVPGKPQQEGVAEGVRLIYTALRREVYIRPHRTWTATTCPSNTHSLWVPGLMALTKEDDMTPEDEKKVQDMITASLRGWIGPRDKTVARIDGQLHEHIRDAAKHSAGEGHDHEFSGRTKEA